MSVDSSSSPAPGLTTPGAILLGAVIVGAFMSVAVYLALRPDPATRPSMAAPSAVGGDGPPAVTTTAIASAMAPARPADVVEAAAAPSTGALPAIAPPTAALTAVAAPASKSAIEQELSAQLEAARGRLLKECWSPSVAAKPSPAKAKYVINATFGADGAQITRGLVSERGNDRADLDSCLAEKLPMLRVAATGQLVYVEVPFTLP